MVNFTRRRIRNLGLTAMAVAAVWLWTRAQDRSLGTSAFSTGYLLLATVLFLALYNARKKLPFLPLGNSAAWLQWHLYAGIGSVGLFALHAGIPWPAGVLNSTLAIFYLATVASGLVGLYLTRSIPRQLSRIGEEVIYERIPVLQMQVRTQAGSAVLESVTASGATTLADFYVARLFDFFHRPRGARYFLRPTTARRRSLMHELTTVRRYLSDHEQSACERLFALIRRKDDLDFHEARQRLLKNWLFVHIGLTYGLVALALLHGLLALAFRGGTA
jgi:hypothetical protein